MRLSAVLGEEFLREVISTEIHTWLQTHTTCAETKRQDKTRQGLAENIAEILHGGETL